MTHGLKLHRTIASGGIANWEQTQFLKAGQRCVVICRVANGKASYEVWTD